MVHLERREGEGPPKTAGLHGEPKSPSAGGEGLSRKTLGPGSGSPSEKLCAFGLAHTPLHTLVPASAKLGAHHEPNPPQGTEL